MNLNDNVMQFDGFLINYLHSLGSRLSAEDELKKVKEQLREKSVQYDNAVRHISMLNAKRKYRIEKKKMKIRTSCANSLGLKFFMHDEYISLKHSKEINKFVPTVQKQPINGVENKIDKLINGDDEINDKETQDDDDDIVVICEVKSSTSNNLTDSMKVAASIQTEHKNKNTNSCNNVSMKHRIIHPALTQQKISEVKNITGTTSNSKTASNSEAIHTTVKKEITLNPQTFFKFPDKQKAETKIMVPKAYENETNVHNYHQVTYKKPFIPKKSEIKIPMTLESTSIKISEKPLKKIPSFIYADSSMYTENGSASLMKSEEKINTKNEHALTKMDTNERGINKLQAVINPTEDEKYSNNEGNAFNVKIDTNELGITNFGSEMRPIEENKINNEENAFTVKIDTNELGITNFGSEMHPIEENKLNIGNGLNQMFGNKSNGCSEIINCSEIIKETTLENPPIIETLEEFPNSEVEEMEEFLNSLLGDNNLTSASNQQMCSSYYNMNEQSDYITLTPVSVNYSYTINYNYYCDADYNSNVIATENLIPQNYDVDESNDLSPFADLFSLPEENLHIFDPTEF